MTYKKRSKNRGDGRTDVHMQEGATSRVMEADKPDGEFYDFYSVSPEYFEYALVNWEAEDFSPAAGCLEK
jgi:hypothetical protein